ncbi:unnamed protein product [Closterium sp. Naga37s-1]|nr:unnamed protein product [Closterium sp. Naga37s-1]
MAVSIQTSLTARLPVVLSPVTKPITCSHVRPSSVSQSSPASLKVTPRTSVAASARTGRVFRIRSSAQSGEQETAESAVAAAAGERPMPNFTWTPSPASQSFHDESRTSPTGLVPFNSGAAGRSLSLQSISKEEALGVVISAAMGTGWKTMTGLEGPSAPADPVDSVDSLGMPIISPVSPRRTARVDFTCNKCGSRTRRAINPHAYREGTVFVQCQGCQTPASMALQSIALWTYSGLMVLLVVLVMAAHALTFHASEGFLE